MAQWGQPGPSAQAGYGQAGYGLVPRLDLPALLPPDLHLTQEQVIQSRQLVKFFFFFFITLKPRVE